MGSCLPGDGGDGGFDQEIFRTYATNYRSGENPEPEAPKVENTKASLKDRILATLRDLVTQE